MECRIPKFKERSIRGGFTPTPNEGQRFAHSPSPLVRCGGFTTIEIIVVVAMASLLVFVVSSFSGNLSVLQNLVGQKLQSRADVDQALQIMTTEMRSAGPSSLGAYAVDSAATSTFLFYSDINKDGLFEHVRYFLATSTIQKGVIEPTGNPLVYATSTEVVTTAMANVLFASSTQLLTYYGPTFTGSEPPLAFPVDATQVRVVRVNFYADINPGKAPQPLFFSATVDLRNLRSN
jgi:type II secretory pathway pseudopilin PulG